MQKVVSFSTTPRNLFGKRNKTVNREIIIGPNAIKFITIAICAVLAIVYLTQSTSGANRSMKIRELSSEQDQMSLEKERLEVEQTRLKSLQEIDQGVTQNVLEPAGTVEHLNP